MKRAIAVLLALTACLVMVLRATQEQSVRGQIGPGVDGVERQGTDNRDLAELSEQSLANSTRQDDSEPSQGQSAQPWLDSSISSPLFGKRTGSQDVPFGLLSPEEYASCEQLNALGTPLSQAEQSSLSAIIQAGGKEQSRFQDRALGARHEYIERRITEFGEGAIQGTEAAFELARKNRELDEPGFLAVYRSAADPDTARVFLMEAGDNQFVDDCFEDLWAVAEGNYSDITEFFVQRSR